MAEQVDLEGFAKVIAGRAAEAAYVKAKQSESPYADLWGDPLKARKTLEAMGLVGGENRPEYIFDDFDEAMRPFSQVRPDGTLVPFGADGKLSLEDFLKNNMDGRALLGIPLRAGTIISENLFPPKTRKSYDDTIKEIREKYPTDEGFAENAVLRGYQRIMNSAPYYAKMAIFGDDQKKRKEYGDKTEREYGAEMLRKIKQLRNTLEGKDSDESAPEQPQGAGAGVGSGVPEGLPTYDAFVKMTLDNRQDIGRIMAEKTLYGG